MNENVILIIIVAIAILFLITLAWFILRRPRPGKKTTPYIDALNALVANDRQTALQKLRETVRIDSHNVDAYLKLGNLLRDEGDVDRALKLHKSLTVRPLTRIQKLNVLKALAIDYIAAGKYTQALELVNEILSQNKREMWALETLLKIYEETGRWDRAFDTLKHIFRLRGEVDNQLLALYKVYAGRSLDEKGEHHRARLKYKEALRVDDRCTPAYLYLGDSYVTEHRLDDAITYWKKLVSAVPEHAHLTFDRLEKTHFEIGDFSSVAQMYQDRIDRQPDDLRSLFALVHIKEKMGHIDEAITLCQQALEKNPESQQARWYLVKCHHAKGEDSRAMEYVLELEKKSEDKEIYQCNNCGYESKDPSWRCPKCKYWRTFL